MFLFGESATIIAEPKTDCWEWKIMGEKKKRET